MHFGATDIHFLRDGPMLSDAGGVFGLTPRVLWEKVISSDNKNRVPTALNCLLIVSQNKRIVVDTGLGTKLNQKHKERVGRTEDSALLAELERLGVRPEDIDIVVNTHLHADHCGGNTRREGDRIVPAFPRAEYWIQRLEWADASFPNERTEATYLAENLMPLGNQVRLINGDAKVTDQVRLVVTPGHTRAHQSVLIEDAGQQLLFLGDMAGRAIYMERLAWIPAYDIDPLQTLETKRRIRNWAIEENVQLIFQHDPEITIGWMRQDGDKFRVEKIM